jgi:hypothetical protein
MLRKPVESSMIRSVGYDPREKVLEIEFNHGGAYQYFNVPKSEYIALMKAESKGRYFLDEIKEIYHYIQIK